MARLLVATLVRNEAGRFLSSALKAWGEFGDAIVAVDDGSSDRTREILYRAGAIVHRRPGGDAAWGRESAARALLWERANAEARPGDYIFVLDADMVPTRDPSALLETGPDTVAFNLYDLWQAEPPLYRDDGQWAGHRRWRPWIARAGPRGPWEWPDRGIHCGHFPRNRGPGRVIFAPPDFGLLHFAYSSPRLRLEKHRQYMDVRSDLRSEELRHAASIIDERPRLRPLPFVPHYALRAARACAS